MKISILKEEKDNKSQILNRILNKDLKKLHSLYKRHGHELRIVGGAVRDILMGNIPKDIDLASSATPEESKKLLNQNDIKTIDTGLQHGTITANMASDNYEITTLRIDTETFGRHANVSFTKDWKQDAERRDLTFNAMSLDFDGTLYDYFEGKKDLESNKAKFVGNTDKRIEEDYLRILRYFRFQGRMNSPDFDKDTLNSVKKNSKGLQQISGERIWMEMQKILSGNHSPEIINMMKKTDVLENIHLSSPNLQEFNKIYKLTKDSNLLMAALLNDVKDLEQLRDKWKFSNPEYDVMKFVIMFRDKEFNLKKLKEYQLMSRTNKELLSKLLEYKGQEKLKNKFEEWTPPTFPINGNDLQKFGISPSPEMGSLLNNLKQKWIDSNFSLTKDDLLNLVRNDQL